MLLRGLVCVCNIFYSYCPLPSTAIILPPPTALILPSTIFLPSTQKRPTGTKFRRSWIFLKNSWLRSAQRRLPFPPPPSHRQYLVSLRLSFPSSSLPSPTAQPPLPPLVLTSSNFSRPASHFPPPSFFPLFLLQYPVSLLPSLPPYVIAQSLILNTVSNPPTFPLSISSIFPYLRPFF